MTPEADLAGLVRGACGENVYLCYQCKKCTAGCPVARHFDLTPNQILRAAQLGQKARILNSKTIWLCATCETCATRCPQGIDITRIMDVFKTVARRERVRARVRAVPLFYDAALRGIRAFGRMYELGMMGELYTRLLLSGEVKVERLIGQELPIAWHLWRKGKLKLLPSLAGRAYQPPQKESDLAYYPGCSLHGTSMEYDRSVRAVAEHLGLRLVEPRGWKCCGAAFAHSTDHLLATRLPLHNVALVEAMGQTRVTMPCPSCYQRHLVALRDCREDTALADKMREETGYAPSSQVHVEHLLTTFTQRIGYERIGQAVRRPLSRLRVVCYYGCTIVRPPKLTGAEDHEYPTNMDALVRVLGAEPLDWSHKTDCCGVSLSVSQPAIAQEMSHRILEDARAVGAQAVVVACPLCQSNLDLRQGEIRARFGGESALPIVYFTDLMGLAYGLEPATLGLDKHFVDPSPILSHASA